ncbi:hypothetical protein EIP91_012326 [Steccherinum ochraceum]|uniref:Uncharacterized protein n=1 Tax=Steccherinum ochraceum TaxID=92696 RepID=A0A4R0RN64_9APHY|nr:hypothetical protein EIP91_012326 [Steccherinum ochraceum]
MHDPKRQRQLPNAPDLLPPIRPPTFIPTSSQTTATCDQSAMVSKTDIEAMSIDDQLEYHASALVQVKRKINAQRAHPRFLTPEILIQIFLTLQTFPAQPRAEYAWVSPLPTEWSIVTHVCYQWREVALMTPALWANIEVLPHNVPRIRAYIHRSKQVPLNITATRGAEHSEEALAVVAPEVRRAGRLTLHVPVRELRNVAMKFPTSAPLLRYLELQDPFPSAQDDCFEPNPIFFTRCDAPFLKELHLYSYQMKWSTTVLPRSLTTLVARAVPGAGGAPLKEIVGALKRLPMLERLELADVVLPVVHNSHLRQLFCRATAIPVALPRLKELSVASDPATCAWTVNSLQFPAADAAISFSIGGNAFEESDELMDPLVASLARLLEDLSPQEVITRFQSTEFYKRLQIHPTLKRDPIMMERCDPVQPSLRLFWPLEFLSEYIPRSLCEALPQLPLQSIRAWTLSSVPEHFLGSKPCFDLLAAAPNITTFNVHSRDTHTDDVEELKWMFEYPLKAKHTEHQLRKLKHLSLHNAVFGHGDHGRTVDRLTRYLRVREEEFGMTLETITLRGCIELSWRDVEKLKAYARVDWDGVETRDTRNTLSDRERREHFPSEWGNGTCACGCGGDFDGYEFPPMNAGSGADYDYLDALYEAGAFDPELSYSMFV